MTVDDSTPDATPVSSKAKKITPPPLSSAAGISPNLRAKGQLLASLQEEVRMLRARIEMLEDERRRFPQPTTTDDTSAPGHATASTATPMWRTKNGKQAGWQPARR